MIEVDVTQEDINNGEQGKYRICPIALAVNRKLTNHYCGVTPYDIFLYKKDTNGFVTCLDVPNKVTDFMLDFDTEKEVKPFKFNLDTRGYDL